jgi:hypothetical protein
MRQPPTLSGVIEGANLETPLHEIVTDQVQVLDRALTGRDEPLHVFQLRLQCGTACRLREP